MNVILPVPNLLAVCGQRSSPQILGETIAKYRQIFVILIDYIDTTSDKDDRRVLFDPIINCILQF